MKPAYDDGWAKLYIADATEGLRELPEKSVHCVVTSPPYHNLRSYLPVGHPDKAKEVGAEPTVAEYVARLVAVFDEVWRVLRSDGTAWVNLGDRYLPNKQLAGVPWRFAFAMQDAGWILRSAITWIKPNPLPESVTDRPTQATEMVYLFSKKSRYFYDQEATREPHSPATVDTPQRRRMITEGKTSRAADFYGALTGSKGDVGERMLNLNPSGRNMRNYWQISTRGYPGSHYATFPPELPERCIKAGTSERGCCSACGAPWRRLVEHKTATPRRENWNGQFEGPNGTARSSRIGGFYDSESRTIGFEPTCSHDAEISPAVVLDPFSGSGTTLWMARKLGRRSIGIDIDERNARLLDERMGPQGVML